MAQFRNKGEDGSKKDHSKSPIKSSVKPKREYEPKGKEKLFSEELIVDNSEVEEPDENDLKRRKAREAEMDELQRIVCEAEEKEKVQHKARFTLEI